MGKLLVVDDEEMIRVCVAAILEATGHEVVVARDGLEALELYDKGRGEIALVVMDITMPNLDGIDTARMLKEIDPSVKVILMSGHTEREMKQVCADAFISKPFRAKDLCGVVQRFLERDVALLGEGAVAMKATG